MGNIERVYFVVKTPDETRAFRDYEKAINHHENVLFDCGHHDGFFITWTMETIETDVEENPKWLEEALGRKSET